MQEINPLRAGAAMIDITPPLGTHLAGSGAGEHRPAETVLDPLFAKAIVFESGGRRVCMVILDLTIVTQDYTDRIRAAIAERNGHPSGGGHGPGDADALRAEHGLLYAGSGFPPGDQ